MSRSFSRRLGALTLAVAASAAVAAPAAQADLLAGPALDAAPGFPAWIGDDTGLRLMPCDDPAVCGEPIDPLVPEGPAALDPNTAVYYDATAELGDRQATLTASIEGHFDAGELAVAAELLFQAKGLQAGQQYTITHPWGVDTVTANDQGDVDKTFLSSSELAAEGTSMASKLGPLVQQVGNDGETLGDPELPGPVTGSRFGTNFVRIQGPGVDLQTSDFAVLGQVDDSSNVTNGIAEISASALNFGSRTVATAGAAQSFTIRNAGSAPMSLAAQVVGASAGDYQLSGCPASLAAGQSCTLSVAWTPGSVGSRNARLQITTNGANGDANLATGDVREISLSGNGTAVPAAAPVVQNAPAPASAPKPQAPAAPRRASISRIVISKLVRLSSAKRNGVSIRVSSANARRLAIQVSRRGRALRSFTVVANNNRIQLLSRKLRRSLKTGTYTVRVTPISASGQRGSTITRQLVVRR